MVRYRTLTGNGLISDKWKLVAIAKNGLVLADTRSRAFGACQRANFRLHEMVLARPPKRDRRPGPNCLTGTVGKNPNPNSRLIQLPQPGFCAREADNFRLTPSTSDLVGCPQDIATTPGCVF